MLFRATSFNYYNNEFKVSLIIWRTVEAGLPSWNSLRSRTRSSARRCWIWPQRRCRWWWPRTCWAAQRTRRTRRWWRRLDQARDWRPPERGSRNHPGWYGTRWSWEDRDTYQFQAQKKTLKNKNWIKAPWHKETAKQGRGRSTGLRLVWGAYDVSSRAYNLAISTRFQIQRISPLIKKILCWSIFQ